MTNIIYPDLYAVINGQKIHSSETDCIAVINPATGETIGSLPIVGIADLDRALEAAQRMWPTWRSTPAAERGNVLIKAADLLRKRANSVAEAATLESGKTLAEAKVEVMMAASTLQWFGEEARRIYGRVIHSHGTGARLHVRQESIGPVASFSPWNFPIGNPARKLAPALAAGCTIILKPAEETPASALAVFECLHEAGLPVGVASIVFGVPDTISSHLIRSGVIRKISFTGSIPVGRHLGALAAQNGVVSTLELGGHGPVVIAADADIETAADQLVASKYRNAGQVCVAPTRFFVERPIYDAFKEAFLKRTQAIKVGDGMETSAQMGPLIHQRRRDAVISLVEDATTKGAEVTFGGNSVDGAGYFYEPTILSHVPATARVMKEEPFGPIAILNSVDSVADAILRSNSLPYGLAAYGFTKSNQTAMLLETGLEAGMVGINTTRISVPESPFGGIKASGHGSEEGVEGLSAYMVPKFINNTF